MAGDFTSFRAMLEDDIWQEIDRGWQVRLPDGRDLDIAEALKEIPAEDLAMPCFWQYSNHTGYTIFLEGYKPNDPERPAAWTYGKYYRIVSGALRNREDEERRYQAAIVAAPGAYYICLYRQMRGAFTEELQLQSVDTTAYTDRAAAKSAAQAIEDAQFKRGYFGTYFVVRKATTREDAEQGIFLDD